ncbi:MAG: hypothetical protein H0U73_02030 [Tatlockia sp.]|nr:hypothetical protein [Tatlockia sp.]
MEYFDRILAFKKASLIENDELINVCGGSCDKGTTYKTCIFTVDRRACWDTQVDFSCD